MENKKALKLIDKIVGDLERNGIIVNTLTDDLRELRPYAVDGKIPLAAKAIRLTYEHIELFETFAIPIPDDEPIEEDGEVISNTSVDPVESLTYMMSLLKDTKNKVNSADLREYVDAMIAYAEENA